MAIRIQHRHTYEAIYECEADSIREAVERAVSDSVSLTGADLTGADLTGADLTGADLTGADLTGADLTGADLTKANVTGADLTGADLTGADLTKANVTGANLTKAHLDGAYLTKADLTGADLRGAHLTGANFTGAYLGHADCADADFTSADFTGATLTKACIFHAGFTRANIAAADLAAIREDLFDMLSHAREEVPALRAALIEGRIDDSVYEDECPNIVGAIAAARGCDYRTMREMTPMFDRPIERFASALKLGDTPENHPIAAIVANWIDEFMAADATQ